MDKIRRKDSEINKYSMALLAFFVFGLTILGGFFKVAFCSNIMLLVALVFAVGGVSSYVFKKERYEQKEPLEEDSEPPNHKLTFGIFIGYVLLAVLNVGFGFWITSLLWTVACVAMMVNTGRYLEAYKDQFGIDP